MNALFSFSASASLYFVGGYRGASDITNNVSVSTTLTADEQYHWYKFDVAETDAPAPFSITLTIPDEVVYNFDVYYRTASSSSRPNVFSNETLATAARKRVMYGIFDQPGTYFIRVYSQNETYTNLYNYQLIVSYNKNTKYMFNYDKSEFINIGNADWAVCADLLGNRTFNNRFYNCDSGRNFKKAYDFINSAYASDFESEFGTGEYKATPEETVVATNYIYSGHLLLKPKFEIETNKTYTIEELMWLLWECDQPIIFYLENELLAGANLPLSRMYVILESVNLSTNTVELYCPMKSDLIIADYDDFIANGTQYSSMVYEYTATNIIESNYRSAFQKVY